MLMFCSATFEIQANAGRYPSHSFWSMKSMHAEITMSAAVKAGMQGMQTHVQCNATSDNSQSQRSRQLELKWLQLLRLELAQLLLHHPGRLRKEPPIEMANIHKSPYRTGQLLWFEFSHAPLRRLHRRCIQWRI